MCEFCPKNRPLAPFSANPPFLKNAMTFETSKVNQFKYSQKCSFFEKPRNECFEVIYA